MKKPKRNYQIDTNSDLYKTIKSGDIILFRFMGKKDFTGGVISHFTSSPYSHAEIYMFNGFSVGAHADGVNWTDIYKIKNKIDIFRLNNGLTREQRLIIQSKVLQSLFKPYDYINLVGFPFIKGKLAIRMAANNAFICSEFVDWAYKNAGIDLIKNKPESIEAPADIGRSNLLTYLGTFYNSKMINNEARNKFLEEEASELSELVSKFLELFSKKDEFYKGLKVNNSLLEGEING